MSGDKKLFGIEAEFLVEGPIPPWSKYTKATNKAKSKESVELMYDFAKLLEKVHNRFDIFLMEEYMENYFSLKFIEKEEDDGSI